MVNDKIGGTDGIDLIRISVKMQHGISHGCKVHYRWNARKVLQDDSGWLEGDLNVLIISLLALDRLPVQDALHVLLSDLEVVAVPHRRLQQDPDRKGQLIWKGRNRRCESAYLLNYPFLTVTGSH